MKVKTTRFGVLEIDETGIIHFPRGIPGFEHLRRFFVLPVEGTGDIHWLQSVEDPAVALLVIDPFKYVNGYTCEIPENETAELDIKDQNEVLLLTTVTVPAGKPAEATTNLLAPIIINTRTNTARQVILNGSDYSTRHRLFAVNNDSTPVKKKNDSLRKCGGGK